MFGRSKKPDFERARLRMVRSQLEGRGIRDRRVLDAMAKVPRHLFVPEELQARAYEDRPLPIGWEQTISQPYIVALMSELLELQGDERVLEIGAGCGYQSAVLAELADQVCALELRPELAALAQRHLSALGVRNVELRAGDGFAPWPGGGPSPASSAPVPPRASRKSSSHSWPREVAWSSRWVRPEGKTCRRSRMVWMESFALNQLDRYASCRCASLPPCLDRALD